MVDDILLVANSLSLSYMFLCGVFQCKEGCAAFHAMVCTLGNYADISTKKCEPAPPGYFVDELKVSSSGPLYPNLKQCLWIEGKRFSNQSESLCVMSR